MCILKEDRDLRFIDRGLQLGPAPARGQLGVDHPPILAFQQVVIGDAGFNQQRKRGVARVAIGRCEALLRIVPAAQHRLGRERADEQVPLLEILADPRRHLVGKRERLVAAILEHRHRDRQRRREALGWQAMKASGAERDQRRRYTTPQRDSRH
jgi:hypothetical protein